MTNTEIIGRHQKKKVPQEVVPKKEEQKRTARQKTTRQKKRKTSPVMIAGFVFMLISLYLSFRIYTFYLLPRLWRLMLMAIVLLMGGIFLVLSLKHKKKGKALMVVEIILCILMAIASVTLPYIEKRVENLFSTRIHTDVQDFHVYTFTSDYRNRHPELGFSTEVSEDLFDYKDSIFLYPQSASEAQKQALEQLNDDLGSVTIRSRKTLWETLQAFYGGVAECILLSDMAVDMLEETSEYASITEDTIVLKTFRTEVEVEDDISSRISEKAFTVFVAGNDTRSEYLSIWGRTDVDILLTVNPETAQALIVSIPRDTYLKNPALSDGMDKLTHLGNDGILNTVKGLNGLFDLDVKYYAAVNFVTFRKIVDTLGGIDIYNPYDFQGIFSYFPAGNIHLNGEEALDYVRERHTLSSGDFDRNEHQAIVLRAILRKLTSREVLEKANDLLNNLSGSVATNIDPSSILELAGEELLNRRNWNIIYYHLGGYGTYDETVSMPGTMLYVVYPYQTQINFVREEILNVLTGEILEQKILPDADMTVWGYN
ncbi:MAG: LCP family protein [Erysipelotrichaceae bacterium]|nr:LCP family protein [Erysipelotrichaceae bacterium]